MSKLISEFPLSSAASSQPDFIMSNRNIFPGWVQGTITVIRNVQHLDQSSSRGWWADLSNTRSSLPIFSRSRPLSLSCLPPMYLPRKMENTSSVKKLRLQISTWNLEFNFRSFRLNWVGLICVNQSVAQNHGNPRIKTQRRDQGRLVELSWEGKKTHSSGAYAF